MKPKGRKKRIVIIGHIHNETDFWITIHCPNSGMIFDFMKKDLELTKGAVK